MSFRKGVAVKTQVADGRLNAYQPVGLSKQPYATSTAPRARAQTKSTALWAPTDEIAPTLAQYIQSGSSLDVPYGVSRGEETNENSYQWSLATKCQS